MGLCCIGIGGLLFTMAGCSARPMTFEILDYTQSGQPKRYGETFDEAYYDMDVHGNVDVVLRRSASEASHPDQSVTQIIHIKSFWRPIPGTTVAHTTQINGTVTYSIASGRVKTILKGAGSVFFKENRRKNRLTGTLEKATLRPARGASVAEPLFKRAELSGTFHARRDARRVSRLIQQSKARSASTSP